MVKTQLPMKRDLSDIEDHENGSFARKYSKQGTGNWTSFSKRSGLRRSNGKISRQKWSNEEKRADPKDAIFTPQEEEFVIKLHGAIGSRWLLIAQQLSGRTETDVKILWNTKLRKKLSAMGIDPVTHRPFSQILADYGNIGAFPKDRTQIDPVVPLDSSNNPFILRQEHQPTTFGFCSQLHAINMATETSNYANSVHDCHKTQPFMTDQRVPSSLNHEPSSFSWSDFLLDDAALASNVEGGHQENVGSMLEQKCDANMDFGVINNVMNNEFEASSSSSNGSFVEAMIERQDEMFSQFPGFYEEPFIL